MRQRRIREKRGGFGRVAGASRWEAERLESRLLLAAVIAPPDPMISGSTLTTPLAPRPGHSFYVAGLDSQGNKLSTWANTSAITPNTTNDLVLNVSVSSTNYVACCEGSNGAVGTSLLTNGLTQSQTAPAPNAGSAAVGTGGASDPSNNTNTISSNVRGTTSFIYTLGSAGGATPSANGYDLTEIDLISGHQDLRTGMFGVDVLVEPVGGDQFLSLSGGAGFTLTSVPDGAGGTHKVDTGSLQMAIVSNGIGLAFTQHIQAVDFEILDPTSFYRELVVTGTPSSAGLSSPPAVPTNVSANVAAGPPVISWDASARAVGYSILRSTTVDGAYTAVGSVVNQTSFVDATALPSTTYFYEVVASGNGDSAAAVPSAAATTTGFGAAAYFYQGQLWQGTPGITENLPLINYNGSDGSNEFPLQVGFDPQQFSVFIEGKIHTDLAGSYTFSAPTDDDGYLWVNGQLVSEDPGLAVKTRPAGVNTPIMLAANTSYGFVFLDDNRTGQWSMAMNWQEPGAGGAAGPVMLVPANHLSSAVDEPPVPALLTVSAGAGNSIAINWAMAGDTSSYAYVVERATADSSGNPTSAFTSVGQAFSGPTTAGANGASNWGATSFVDTTAAAGTAYIYRVGAILPNETTPATLSATSLAITAGSPGGSSNLSGTFSGRLPAAALIAGQKVNLNQTVTLVDSTNAAEKGLVRADLFLASGTSVDANSIHLGTMSQRVNLKLHGRATLKFKSVVLPASVASGSYHLVAQITDPKAATFDVASVASISVAAAQIDLSGIFSKAVVPGKSGRTPLTFSVKNSGNVAATGPITFSIDTSADGLLTDATTFAVLKKSKVSIKPGKALKISSTVKLPAGSYFVLIQIDPNNAFKDVNLANNLIVSNSALLVS